MRELLTRLLQGHADAVDLCMAVFEWANHYDHVIDGDVSGPSATQALHQSMWLIAVVIPANPFFKANEPALRVTLANSILTWRVANDFQRSGDPHKLMVAHVLRWAPIEFFMHCARIVGGEKWASDAGPWFWNEMTKAHTFSEFVAESKE